MVEADVRPEEILGNVQDRAAEPECFEVGMDRNRVWDSA